MNDDTDYVAALHRELAGCEFRIGLYPEPDVDTRPLDWAEWKQGQVERVNYRDAVRAQIAEIERAKAKPRAARGNGA